MATPQLPLNYQPPAGPNPVSPVGIIGDQRDTNTQLQARVSPEGYLLTAIAGSSGGAGGAVLVTSATSGLPTTGVRGPLSDISVVNLGSGSFAAIPINAAAHYLAITNPSTTINIGVNAAGGTALVGSPGTATLTPGGSFIWENNFIPTNAITICGSSGSGATIYAG